MTLTLRKWLGLFKIYLQEGLAYRAAAVIWILTDTVPAMIMPLVFISAAKTNGTVGGYTDAQFVQYYLTMLVITMFITSHLMWDLAQEIKEGVFTINLIRPISYFQVCFFRNLTWRLMRLGIFIPVFLLLLYFYRDFLAGASGYWGWEAWAAIILGHLVSFTLVFMLTMIALFTQEAQAIFGLYYIPMLFLSGQLFPVYLLPDWALSITQVLPFYYTLALPLDIILGKVSGSAILGLLGMQIAWIVVHLLLARFMWRAGLKRYTAVGM